MATRDWNDLRYVLAVAREGSLSRAARTLHVNHTTVSRRLAHLEEDLGVRLFDRTPDGHVATAAGEDLIEAATRIEAEVVEIDRKVLGRDRRIDGRLVVTILDSLGMTFARELTDFQRQYPEVQLVIESDVRLFDLARREADIALRVGNEPDESLFGRKVGRIEFALYGARSLVGETVPKELRGLPWLGWHERFEARQTEERMRGVDPDAKVVARFTGVVPFQAALVAGMGVAYTTCLFGDRQADLLRLRPVEPDFGMDLWLLTHPDLRQSARVRAFMSHFYEALLPYRKRLAGEGKPPRLVPTP